MHERISGTKDMTDEVDPLVKEKLNSTKSSHKIFRKWGQHEKTKSENDRDRKR